MPEPKRIGAVEIDENLTHERRSWLFERAGWVTLAVLLLLALAGLFGKGLLSYTSASTHDKSLQVEYERFVRFQAPITLRIHLQPEGLSSPKGKVWLSREYLDAIRIEQIEPEPESQETVEDGVLYTFPAQDPNNSVAVTLDAVVEKVGKHYGRIGSAPDRSVSFWQFAYP
jgi:hypothetical protein